MIDPPSKSAPSMLADLLNIRGKFGRMMVFCQNYLYYCVKTPSAVESQMLSAGRKYNYSIYRVNVKLMLQIEEELVVENCSRILMNSLDKHKDAVATQCGRYLYLLVTEDDWWYINKIRLHDFMLISSYRITTCFSRRGFLFYGQKIIHFVKNDTFLALTEMTSFNTYGTMLRTSFFELNFDEAKKEIFAKELILPAVPTVSASMIYKASYEIGMICTGSNTGTFFHLGHANQLFVLDRDSNVWCAFTLDDESIELPMAMDARGPHFIRRFGFNEGLIIHSLNEGFYLLEMDKIRCVYRFKWLFRSSTFILPNNDASVLAHGLSSFIEIIYRPLKPLPLSQLCIRQLANSVSLFEKEQQQKQSQFSSNENTIENSGKLPRQLINFACRINEHVFRLASEQRIKSIMKICDLDELKAQLKILEIGNIPVPEYLLRSSKEKTPAQKQEEEDLMELERWASETA